MPDQPPRWYTLESDAVVAELETNTAAGLSQDEARRRLELHGPNEIEQAKQRTPLGMLLAQFSDFMIAVLLAAAVVSGVVGDLKDAIAILVIVILNAVIGAVQEYRADRAVAALRKLATPVVRVLRGDAWTELPATQIVAGDLVRLEAGNIVPADLRLMEAADLRVDESSLTGESLPVTKANAALEAEAEDLPVGDRTNIAHRGTQVIAGRGIGVVVATGMDTELGRVANLLHGAGTVKTPLQRRLARFGKNLALVVLAICVMVFLFGLARGEPVLLMLLTSVSLAVAAIPEALPAVVTVSLALGARKMIRRRALIRRLPAVESLGSVTHVCADKTGTLTENRMRVDAVFADGQRLDGLPADAEPGGPWELLGRAFAFVNDARREGDELAGDPTEVALLHAAEEAGLAPAELAREAPRIGELAFDGERKRMTTVHRADEGALALTKGAPEVVVGRCHHALTGTGPAELDSAAVLAEAERLAEEGYRVLAFAYRSFPEGAEGREDELDVELIFLGLAALVDPPREGAAKAVEQCRSAGITPVMITGDHPGTARAIARRLGLASPEDGVLTGRELERLSPEQLRERVESTRIYARVSPEQKIDIVRALQENGEFVAMTGDGVNDAPALKRAEIGVAMGLRGTEVAREAADMVLLDDDFSTIVTAVREGRRVFDNIRKFVRYTMTSNSGEIWTLFAAPLLGLPLPLLPIQILWINLVTDGLPGLALAVEPEERGLMARPPRPPRESLFAHGLWQHVLWVGLLIAALSIGAQAWALRAGSERWQSVVFTVLTLSQLAHALVIRSERDSLLTLGLRSNLPLLGAVLLTVGLQLAVLYVPAMNVVFHTAPLAAGELALCFLLPLVVVVAVELEKLVLRRYGNRATTNSSSPPWNSSGPSR